MRCVVLAIALIVSLAGVAAAQPFHGGPGGPPGGHGPGMGPGGFGRPGGMEHMEGRFRQRFQSANITHDGRLTLQQARDAGMNAVARRFDAIDTAHKGFVTFEDIRAYRRAMMQQRRAAQGPEDGADPGPGDPPPQ